MINKNFYEAPEAELLMINLENNFLESEPEETGNFEKGNVKPQSSDMWGWM